MSFSEYLEKARRGRTFTYNTNQITNPKTGAPNYDYKPGGTAKNVVRTNRQFTSPPSVHPASVTKPGLMQEVHNPGSRGGRGFYNERGKWRYGTPPMQGGPSVSDKMGNVRPAMHPHDAMIDDILFRWYQSHPKYRGTELNRHLAYASTNDIIEITKALHEGLAPYSSRFKSDMENPEHRVAARIGKLQHYARIHAGFRYELPKNAHNALVPEASTKFETEPPPGTPESNAKIAKDTKKESRKFRYGSPPGTIESWADKNTTKSFKDFLVPLEKASSGVHPLPIKGVGMRNVKAPGSKGGVGYWNGKGEWVYGTMPMGNYSSTSSSSASTTSTIERPSVNPVDNTEKMLLQDKKPWTFISGHHTSRNPEANHQMHQNLIREIQRRGYKPMGVTGYYTYQAKEPGGQDGVTQEPSYLVPNMGTKEAIELGNNYDQEAVLTHEGMFNVKTPTMYKVLSKKFIRGEIPKNQDQSVIEHKGGAKSTFLINTDWDHELPAPAGYHTHLGKSFNSTLNKSLSRPAKYMVAAEIIFLNEEDKKKKNANRRASKQGIQSQPQL